MTFSLRIGTRASALALWQAEHVASRLRDLGAPPPVLVPITTSGDRLEDRALADVGGKGLFLKEIEDALERGEVDLAVHSLKDVPAELPSGLALAAFLPREDPRDAWVARDAAVLALTPPGARVGTSSPRRRQQLAARRPDLEWLPLRGNVGSRLGKLDCGEVDAIVLAAAGLSRLGYLQRAGEIFAIDFSIPAAGQGIIAIEIRGNDAATRLWVSRLDDGRSRVEAAAERATVAALGADCRLPVGVHASWDGDGALLRLWGFVGAVGGAVQGQNLRAEEGPVAVADEAAAIQAGRRFGAALLGRGAAVLLRPNDLTEIV